MLMPINETYSNRTTIFPSSISAKNPNDNTQVLLWGEPQTYQFYVRYGDGEVFVPNFLGYSEDSIGTGEYLQKMFSEFCNQNSERITKMWITTVLDYSIVDIAKKDETTTISKTGSDVVSHIVDESTEQNGSSVVTHTGTDSDTKSGNISNTRTDNLNDIDSVSAYNELSGATERSKTQHTGTQGNVETYNNVVDTTTHNTTDTTTYNGLGTTDTANNSDTTTYGSVETTTYHFQGNLGVVTNQSMIEQERNVQEMNFNRWLVTEFANFVYVILG